jgi:hypothetical protein
LPIYWFEVGEHKEFSPYYIKDRREVIDIVRDGLKIAYRRGMQTRKGGHRNLK